MGAIERKRFIDKLKLTYPYVVPLEDNKAAAVLIDSAWDIFDTDTYRPIRQKSSSLYSLELNKGTPDYAIVIDANPLYTMLYKFSTKTYINMAEQLLTKGLSLVRFCRVADQYAAFIARNDRTRKLIALDINMQKLCPFSTQIEVYSEQTVACDMGNGYLNIYRNKKLIATLNGAHAMEEHTIYPNYTVFQCGVYGQRGTDVYDRDFNQILQVRDRYGIKVDFQHLLVVTKTLATDDTIHIYDQQKKKFITPQEWFDGTFTLNTQDTGKITFMYRGDNIWAKPNTELLGFIYIGNLTILGQGYLSQYELKAAIESGLIPKKLLEVSR